MKKKSIALLMAVVMLFGATFAGVYAWLTDTSETVTNTFVEGKIEIELDEADVNIETDGVITYTEYVKDNEKVSGIANADRVTANEYDVIPGSTYSKDPRVTVKANSEKCYLFVKLEETGNPSTYYTYTPNWTGWTPLGTEYPNVYWRVVDASTTAQSWYLLTGNTTYPDGYIKVNDTVTQGTMSAAAAAELKWTAYAIQYANFENNEIGAWNAISK